MPQLLFLLLSILGYILSSPLPLLLPTDASPEFLRHGNSVVQLMKHYQNKQPSELSNVLESYKSIYSEKNPSVDFDHVLKYATSVILAEKIDANPLDHRSKEWQKQYQANLKDFLPEIMISKKDFIYTNQVKFELSVMAALHRKISAYLQSMSLDADSLRSGERFLHFLLANQIHFNLFQKEILTALYQMASQQWSLRAEKAMQIYSYIMGKTSKMDGKKLWQKFQFDKLAALRRGYIPDFKLSPMVISIDKSVYLLQKYVGRGSYGIVYEGFELHHQDQSLIFKIMIDQTDKRSLQNELSVLTILDRLVAYEEDQGFLIQKKVPGVSLHSLMPLLLADPEKLTKTKSDFLKLNNDFFLKTHFIHNDIAPRNVIVDPKTGALSLIDFGLSTPAPWWNSQLSEVELKKSYANAAMEFQLDILFTKVKEHLKRASTNVEEAVHILDQMIELYKGIGRDYLWLVNWKADIQKGNVQNEKRSRTSEKQQANQRTNSFLELF